MKLYPVIFLLAFLAAGCSVVPTFKSLAPVLNSSPAAASSAGDTSNAIKSSTVKVKSVQADLHAAAATRPNDAVITGADVGLGSALVDLDLGAKSVQQTMAALTTMAQERASLEKQISTLTYELQTATAAAAKYKAKYDDSWFGGKAHFWFWVLVIVAGVGLIVSIVVNNASNIFVNGPMILVNIGTGIVKLFAKLFGWAFSAVGGIVTWFDNILEKMVVKTSTKTPPANPTPGG